MNEQKRRRNNGCSTQTQRTITHRWKHIKNYHTNQTKQKNWNEQERNDKNGKSKRFGKTDKLEHNWWERLPTMFNRSLDKITSSRAKVQRYYRERYNSIPRQTGSTPTQATKARRA